jgi:hypothetical protein
MNARSLKCTMGAVLVLGMLAALPAQAGSGLIKVTHASTPYSVAVQPAVSQTKAPEVQVAVMASSPSQPAAKRAVYICSADDGCAGNVAWKGHSIFGASIV